MRERGQKKRWSRILTGRSGVGGFPADQVEGEEWYKRAMRAHANCIENLPVFGAIVLALVFNSSSNFRLAWAAHPAATRPGCSLASSTAS